MILLHVHFFVSAHRCFEIDQIPAAAVRVGDRPDGAVRPTESTLLVAADRLDVDIDVGAKVCSTHANDSTKTAEGQLVVALPVQRDNHLASTPDQLVDTQVLEVAAVRHVHERAGLVGQSERFLDQIEDALVQPLPGPCS